MLYSTLYRAASVTEFQRRLIVVAEDAVAVSPFGAGAMPDDDPPSEGGKMGSVLVVLVSVGAVLVAFVDAADFPSPASPPSGGD